jgi:hypothetical protein
MIGVILIGFSEIRKRVCRARKRLFILTWDKISTTLFSLARLKERPQA